jgi:hypothetical protein
MNERTERRVFDVPEDEVVEGVACTWCRAGVGDDCDWRERKGGRAHAQRWRDYWNATHDRAQRTPVYTRGGVEA